MGPVLKGIWLTGPNVKSLPDGWTQAEGIQTEGLEVSIDPKQLECLLRFDFGTERISQNSIEAIKKNLILAFRDLGYPLVLVEPPAQSLQYGLLRFQVTFSKLGEVTVHGNRWFSDRAILKPLQTTPGQPISAKKLLGDITWLNRNPFRSLDAIFTPGNNLHTTDIQLVVQDRFLLRTYGGGDNTGTKPTGTARWFGGFDWAQAFNINSILSYQFTSGSSYNEFNSHTVHYTAYLPWRDVLVLYGGYSKGHAPIPGFRSNGWSAQGSLRYEVDLYPAYLGFLQQIDFGFDVKSMKNNLIYLGETEIFAQGGMVNVTQFMLAMNIGYKAGPHQFSGQALAYLSPGEILANQENKNFNNLRPGATNTYYFWRTNLGYTWTAHRYFELFAQARAQWTTRTLLPSEEFAIGGYDTVRGYEEREYLADRGICLNLELRCPSLNYRHCFRGKQIESQLMLLTFLDWAYANNITDEVPEPNNALIYSVGPGFRYHFGNYINARFDYGFQLKRPPIDSYQLGRYHVGVLVSF